MRRSDQPANCCGTLAAIIGWNNIFLPEHCTSGVRLVQFILTIKGIQISGTKKVRLPLGERLNNDFPGDGIIQRELRFAHANDVGGTALL